MENLTGGTPPVRYLPCVVPCKLYFSTEKADIISVSVNDLDGKLAVPKEEGINSTLVWFDPEKNLQFTIDAPLGENDILHIAESVSLVETTK